MCQLGGGNINTQSCNCTAIPTDQIKIFTCLQLLSPVCHIANTLTLEIYKTHAVWKLIQWQDVVFLQFAYELL